MSNKRMGVASSSDLNQIAGFLSTIGMPKNEIKEALDNILNEKQYVRKLNSREQDIYSGAVTRACTIVPAFRDAIAVIRPYYNALTPTLYTDPYSRVGIGYGFFTQYVTPAERSAMIIHEAMHVLYNHFVRGADHLHNPEIFNLAGDFEINSTLARDKNISLKHGVLPNQGDFRYPRDLSMEQYISLLLQDIKDSSDGQSSGVSSYGGTNSEDNNNPSGSDNSPQEHGNEKNSSNKNDGTSGSTGNGGKENQGYSQDTNGNVDTASIAGNSQKSKKTSTCDPAVEKHETEADSIGIERASTTEQNVVRASTRACIADELASRARGNTSMHEILSIVNTRMSPPRVRWQNILRTCIMRTTDNIVRGGTDYSYRKVSRRHTNTEYIMPGIVSYQPKVLLGIDTSGSMANDDYMKFLAEATDLTKRASRNSPMEYFCVDAEVQEPRVFKNVQDITFTGGGGTDMSEAFAYVNKLSKGKRPDIFVLTTDGGTDWEECFQEIREAPYNYYTVILVTDETCAPDDTQKLGRKGKIIVIDE